MIRHRTNDQLSDKEDHNDDDNCGPTMKGWREWLEGVEQKDHTRLLREQRYSEKQR